jgi:allantoicase
MEVHSNPSGKAIKYTRLAPIINNYPAEVRTTGEARTAVSVMRATVREGLKRGGVFDVRFMERHPYTSQAFIPMGKAEVSLRKPFISAAGPSGGRGMIWSFPGQGDMRAVGHDADP